MGYPCNSLLALKAHHISVDGIQWFPGCAEGAIDDNPRLQPGVKAYPKLHSSSEGAGRYF